MCGGVGVRGWSGRGGGYRACSTPLIFSDSPNPLGLPECRTVSDICGLSSWSSSYLIPSSIPYCPPLPSCCKRQLTMPFCIAATAQGQLLFFPGKPLPP